MTNEDYQGLSVSTKVVLSLVVTSLMGIALTIVLSFFRAVHRALWKQKKPNRTTRSRVTDSAKTTQAEDISTQPQRRSNLSYKTLVHKSKASKHKKQDDGKIVDHPLYITSLKDHRDRVNGFGWSLDGSLLVSACEDRCVRVFSFSGAIDKGIQTRQINVQGVPVDVDFVTDVNTLVILCKGFMETATLMFYSNRPSELGGIHWECTKTIEKVFYADSPLRLEAVTNPDVGKTLIIACSATKEAKIYDTNGVALSSFAPNSLLNHDLAVAHNGHLASVATFTADAKVWELKFSRDGVYQKSPKVMDLRGHKSKVMTVGFSMDSTKAVSVSEDGIMKIWNVDVRYDMQEDPKCLLTVKLSLKANDYYHRVAFGPDDAFAAAVKSDIHIIDITDGAVIEQIEGAHDGLITMLHWCPEELPCRRGTVRVLASSGVDKRVRLWAHPEDIEGNA